MSAGCWCRCNCSCWRRSRRSWCRRCRGRWCRCWCWCGTRSHKSINLVIVRDIDASPSSDASVEFASAHHQFIRPATGINNTASISIKTMQQLMTGSIIIYYPHDHVIGTVSRGNERRGATVRAHAPRTGDSRRIGCSNPKSREHGPAGAQSDIAALAGPIGYPCRNRRARQ